MSRFINWQNRYNCTTFPVAIFDKSKELIDYNNSFEKSFKNDEKIIKNIKEILLVKTDSNVHSWDFENKNYFIQKEILDTNTILTFIEVTEYMKMIDQVVEQKMKIFSESKIDHINDIVSQVSHAILNPLFIIKANLNFLTGKISDQKLIEKVEKVNTTLDRVVEFSEALRSNLINKNKDSLENLSDFISKIPHYHKEEFKIYEISYTQIGNCEDIVINPAIKFAINSVIQNSVDVLKRNEADWIRVECEKVDDKFRILISNSGPVISNAERKQLFKHPFTTKFDGKHSGYSLFTSSNFLKSQGAQITYEVDDEIGSFIISFDI